MCVSSKACVSICHHMAPHVINRFEEAAALKQQIRDIENLRGSPWIMVSSKDVADPPVAAEPRKAKAKSYACAECGDLVCHTEMIKSHRPQHSVDQNMVEHLTLAPQGSRRERMRSTKTSYKKICVPCEIKYRTAEVQSAAGTPNAADFEEDYASEARSHFSADLFRFVS